MDLQEFNGEDMYFDEPLNPEVEGLITLAAERYGDGPEDGSAERALLRAYFLEPEHLTVLVALYRFFYYRHCYREALLIAERAIAICSERLRLPVRWQDLGEGDLGRSVLVSMTLTRFLLLALKGSGYLLLRLGDPAAALARFEKIAEIDTSDRLGVQSLASLARGAITRAEVERLGDRVRYLSG
jgi:tetratricopeptide (TPR) repeat protein